MPKGYWLVRIDVDDMEQYKRYQAALAAPLKHFEARFLVRGGKFEAVEGTSRARNVVIEFPSYDAAIGCWQSAEYQAALKIRESVATADVVIVEGYETPPG